MLVHELYMAMRGMSSACVATSGLDDSPTAVRPSSFTAAWIWSAFPFTGTTKEPAGMSVSPALKSASAAWTSTSFSR